MIKKLENTTLSLVLALIIFSMILMGCGKKIEEGNINKTEKFTIKIGSKDFTESLILGELYAIALESAGYTVERKLNLGSSLVHSALINGEIDFYPEYTGTGLLSILKESPKYDSDEVYNEVYKQYKEKFHLIWLNPSLANDGQGLVIAKRASDKYNIHTISDLQKNASKIRFVSQGEFDKREDGLLALTKNYGPFNFKSKKIYDNGLKYDVLHNDKGDVAVAYTTEGQLSKSEFIILEDDKHVWPPYNIAPVIKEELINKNPEIKDILNAITAKLDNKTIIDLNAEVDINKREYEEVAREFYDKEFED